MLFTRKEKVLKNKTKDLELFAYMLLKLITFRNLAIVVQMISNVFSERTSIS